MRYTAMLSVLLLAMASASRAQDKPDFSGQWALVAAAPASAAGVAPKLIVRQPIVRTTARGTPMKPAFTTLTVERVFADRTSRDTFQIGVEGGMIAGGGFRSTNSVRWEESRLVIASASYSGPGSESLLNEHSEVWELDPDGLLMITVADIEAGHDSTSKRLTYRRD